MIPPSPIGKFTARDEVVMDNEERLLSARSHKQNLKEKHMEFVRRMV